MVRCDGDGVPTEEGRLVERWLLGSVRRGACCPRLYIIHDVFPLM